jgi:hypothetical protein
LVLGSKKKDKSSGKHQFQWLVVPWVNFSETTSENRYRRLKSKCFRTHWLVRQVLVSLLAEVFSSCP